jgi:hypothetical protein
LRDGGLESRFCGADTLTGGFFVERFFASTGLLRLADAAAVLFFFATTFLVARPLGFREAVCIPFLAAGDFFPIAGFFDFGAAVILPGRFGFLGVAFLPLVARILFDADKPLLLALVIRLLISHLGVENEPAPTLNPAHTLVYGCFISTISWQVKKIP